MYEIDYLDDDESNPVYININSNHLPQSDDDVTIDGAHYKVIKVEHILNTGNSDTSIEERFIVRIQKKKMRF